MAIEAPLSKFKKGNLKIYIAFCLVAAVVLAYDGYLSKYKWSGRHSFYKKNVIDNDGKPNGTMKFNRITPLFLGVGIVLLALRYRSVKDRKILADEDGLVLSGGQKIVYDSIGKIDKTYFQSKGFFIITYKDAAGKEVECRLSERGWDNLSAVLDELVVKIS